MFLAWNEIKRNKLRFILIIGVLLLVSYLVFFLSGLANGLKDLNREAVDKWDATGIVLTEESNKSLMQSTITVDDLEGINVDEYAIIGQLNAIAGNGDEKTGIAVFGIRDDQFLMPNLTEGKVFSKTHEVIASDTLKEEGFEIGDTLDLSSSDEKLTITGFTDNARFNAAPVLYGNLETYQRIKYGEAASQKEERISGIVFKAKNVNDVTKNESLDAIEIETFISKLPGYTEQSITLNFMIYFLFIISAVIVAIFLYVLTVQKISMFGLMKAQGISNVYLAKSIIAQTFILATIGVVIGLTLTLLTGAFLPSAVPVSFDTLTMIIYGVILIIVAILGALFSVLTIFKIDPLTAIGG